MKTTNKSLCAISVFIVVAQNYVSQISHVSNAQINAWTLHDWTGALLNVALAGAFAWKIFLTDPNLPTPPAPAFGEVAK